ncbi:DNA-processing protein DprA [Microbacterium sp. 1P10UB]|uniref:DNA-processing protein DprA n=1 Tax=unclassified Microbacterium TaxID=2609290 RepID=UPI0039A14A4D
MSAPDLDPRSAREALRGIVGEVEAMSDDEVTDRYARLVWSTLVEPGDSVAHRFVAALGPAAALRELHAGMKAGVFARAGIDASDGDRGARRWLPRRKDDATRTALDAARRAGCIALCPGDEHWPARVDDLGAHAPLALWVRGDPALLSAPVPALALVGARAATGYGEAVAVEFAASLAATGVSIVSGAAYGIDGAAHRAALAAGGTTFALLAGGVDRPYPVGHSELISRIVSAGVVVSEAPCGTAPTKWRFLQRNRLIAALSDATVVVEAGWRSGSLNTAAHAASLGRPLGAVPGPITSAASTGCHRLLREFDARCITSADDARELLALHGDALWPASGGPLGTHSPHTDDRSRDDDRSRTDDRSRVLDALSTRTWRTGADVARHAGMAEQDVEGVLGLLLLDGAVKSSPSGWRMLPRAASPGIGR